jgi:hypothetical protein
MASWRTIAGMREVKKKNKASDSQHLSIRIIVLKQCAYEYKMYLFRFIIENHLNAEIMEFFIVCILVLIVFFTCFLCLL